MKGKEGNGRNRFEFDKAEESAEGEVNRVDSIPIAGSDS